MHAFATWVPPHRRRRKRHFPDLNWEHLELREAPWRHSYGLTQVFHRSMLEFSDLWKLCQDHFGATINGSGSFPPCLERRFQLIPY
jgi:hypothetical protein